jgi:hypothetical protein
MPLWDGAQLVKQFKLEAGLQDASEMDDSVDICPMLSIAQVKVLNRISAIYPNALYSPPFQLIASADRTTFSFGTDSAGNPIVAKGWVQISPRATAFSGDSFAGWVEGQDFLDEGDKIRVVSNRTYSGTLYCRAVLTPPDITLLVPPVLNPPDARQLIVVQAVKDFAGQGEQNAKVAARMQAKWNEDFPALMLTMRKRFRGGGGMVDSARWYLTADFTVT